MADVRESFPVLEGASGEGLALREVQQGDAVAAKNGLLGFAFKDATGNAIAAPVKVEGNAPGDAVPGLVFKDSAGNLVYPQLNASNALPVSFTPPTGVGKSSRGTATGSASNTTVVSLTLANSKIYKNLEYIVSCFKETIYQVILSDNAVETIISDALVGPGMFTASCSLLQKEITTGATGTQLLLIKGQNLSGTSDFRASLCVELAN